MASLLQGLWLHFSQPRIAGGPAAVIFLAAVNLHVPHSHEFCSRHAASDVAAKACIASSFFWAWAPVMALAAWIYTLRTTTEAAAAMWCLAGA